MSKSSFTPQYRKIYEHLRSQILIGAYAPGSRLPFERELCETYNVQRVTVRKALELLVQDNLIRKQPGKGSFVRGVQPEAQRPAQSGTLLFAMDKSNSTLLNTSAHNVRLFYLMEKLCLARGYTLLYAGVSDDEELRALAEKHRIDGAFLVGSLPESCIGTLASLQIPAVCVNHVSPNALSVLSDNHGGMLAAMEYLVLLGHRRIAFLGAANSVNSRERLLGYLAALHEYNLEYDSRLILESGGTYEGSCSAVASMLSEFAEDRPTALLASGDMIAIGAMETALRSGLSIPDEMSIIGFGNVDLCRFCSPQLTSIGPDMQHLANVAADHLIPMLGRAPSQEHRYVLRIPVTLTERGSTASCAKALPLTATLR